MRGALQLLCSARGPCPVWGQRPLKQADGTSPLPSSCLTLDSIAHSLHTQFLPLWVANMASEGNNSLGVKTSNHLQLCPKLSVRTTDQMRLVWLFSELMSIRRLLSRKSIMALLDIISCLISDFCQYGKWIVDQIKILSLKNTCHFSRDAQLNQHALNRWKYLLFYWKIGTILICNIVEINVFHLLLS